MCKWISNYEHIGVNFFLILSFKEAPRKIYNLLLIVHIRVRVVFNVVLWKVTTFWLFSRYADERRIPSNGRTNNNNSPSIMVRTRHTKNNHIKEEDFIFSLKLRGVGCDWGLFCGFNVLFSYIIWNFFYPEKNMIVFAVFAVLKKRRCLIDVWVRMC